MGALKVLGVALAVVLAIPAVMIGGMWAGYFIVLIIEKFQWLAPPVAPFA